VLARTRRGRLAAEQGGLGAGSLVYAASLSKQLTAACLALLVRRGQVDLGSTLAGWLPELPSWAGGVRVRHLVHHIGALPADPDVDALLGADRTTAGVVAALGAAPPPGRPPGTGFAYSNAGYVCLGVVVERAAGMPLPRFAAENVFGPAGMRRTRFWSGPTPAPPGATALEPARPAPLSLGDGGAWSTADDLQRWARCLDQDGLGITGIVQAPGHLDDGTALDYAWGMSARQHDGVRLHGHGGAWAGLRAILARVPEEGVDLVVVATADRTERTVELTDALLDLLLA
jgi:CubicO group peptidase (beta-lactamase class C family)